MKKRQFLRWTLMLSLIIVGLLISASLGWFKIMWSGDATRLTVATFGVFALATALCGRLRWKLNAVADASVAADVRDRVIKDIERSVQHGWFASSVCVTLGLLGTVVGLFMMLMNAPEAGPAVAELLAKQIRTGMSTALITTIVGGFLGLLLEVQFHFLEQAVVSIKDEAKGGGK